MASSSLVHGDFGLTTLFMEENKLYLCDICTEFTELNSINGCAHSFCIDCITKHISSKLELNVVKVQCPGLSCKTFLQTESLTPLLPKSVIDSWSDALCRDFLNDLQTLYCPFKDCSEMLLIENEGEVVRESECPSCHRLFCAQCDVAWHSEIDCEEYGRLKEDSGGLMVMELAKEFKWSRCPSCKFYVEKTQGCPHITCRCNYQFCYGCGIEWSAAHGGCSRE